MIRAQIPRSKKREGDKEATTNDVDPNGGRFLMIRPAEDSAPPANLQVVLNWLKNYRVEAKN